MAAFVFFYFGLPDYWVCVCYTPLLMINLWLIVLRKLFVSTMDSHEKRMIFTLMWEKRDPLLSRKIFHTSRERAKFRSANTPSTADVPGQVLLVKRSGFPLLSGHRTCNSESLYYSFIACPQQVAVKKTSTCTNLASYSVNTVVLQFYVLPVQQVFVCITDGLYLMTLSSSTWVD